MNRDQIGLLKTLAILAVLGVIFYLDPDILLLGLVIGGVSLIFGIPAVLIFLAISPRPKDASKSRDDKEDTGRPG